MKGWKQDLLGNVATLQRGFDLPHRLRKEGTVPIVTSSGFEATHSEAKVRGPGIVTGRYGTIGKVFFVEGDFWPLNTTLYVRDFHGNDPRFLSYLLRTIDFHTHSGKSGVPGVNRNDLHEITVRLPSAKKDQEAIADALNDADGLIESLEQLLAKKRLIKQGAMQQLLTGRKRLLGFSGPWQSTTIGATSTKIGSGITPTGGNRVYKHAGRPFLRSQNVGWGSLLLDDIAYIDEETHNAFPATEIESGDVFLNITGASIGRSAIADSRVAGGNVNQHVCIIRTDRSAVDPRFLNYCLLSRIGQAQIDSFQAGGNRQGLNFGQVRSICFQVPAINEQAGIATILSEMDADIRATTEKIGKERQIKQGMMQQLLTGRIRLK